MPRALALTHTVVDGLFWIFGIGLSVYLAAACFGFISNSSEHYSNFIFGVVGMSGFVTINGLIDERLSGSEGNDRWFWPRFSAAVIGTLLALALVRLCALARGAARDHPTVLPALRLQCRPRLPWLHPAAQLVPLGRPAHDHDRRLGDLLLFRFAYSLSAAGDPSVRPRVRHELYGPRDQRRPVLVRARGGGQHVVSGPVCRRAVRYRQPAHGAGGRQGCGKPFRRRRRLSRHHRQRHRRLDHGHGCRQCRAHRAG